MANRNRKGGLMTPRLIVFILVASVQCYSCAVPAERKPREFGDSLGIFKVIPATRSEWVAGGQCLADLEFNRAGELVKVSTRTAGCYSGSPATALYLTPNKKDFYELKNNENSVTFGDGTTTCYGPPIPNPPMCVCTRTPCP